MKKKLFLMGILTIAFGILFTSCEININHDPEDELILRSGYAWVTYEGFIFEFNHDSITFGLDKYGLVFKSNGEVDTVEKNVHGQWRKTDSDIYIVDGDHILIGNKIYDFRIDDDELSFGGKDFDKERIGRYK